MLTSLGVRFQGQEDHGPFNSLNNLLHDHAHLAVFMNYVISNCDPSSLVSRADPVPSGAARVVKVARVVARG